MCSKFLGMESILVKKITAKKFFYILGYFYLLFYFICNFVFNHVTLFSLTKKLLHTLRNKINKNVANCLKTKNFKNSKLFELSKYKKNDQTNSLGSTIYFIFGKIERFRILEILNYTFVWTLR